MDNVDEQDGGNVSAGRQMKTGPQALLMPLELVYDHFSDVVKFSSVPRMISFGMADFPKL